MTKIKIFLLICITFVLTYFIIENSVLAPPIKLFGKELFQIHLSIVIIAFFFLGLIFGWLCHFNWSRTRRKKAQLASREQKAPESQDPDQQEEKKQ
jgi:uncharacterized integral membrane protein